MATLWNQILNLTVRVDFRAQKRLQGNIVASYLSLYALSSEMYFFYNENAFPKSVSHWKTSPSRDTPDMYRIYVVQADKWRLS